MQASRTSSIGGDCNPVELVCTALNSELINYIDTGLDVAQGFLTQLPDHYRDTIRSIYVQFLENTEKQSNERYAEILQKCVEEFQLRKQDLFQRAPDEYNRQLDFFLLEKEDDLLEQELARNFGRKNWGVIHLKTDEQTFTRARWLLVLLNRSDLNEAQKAEQTKLILGSKGDVHLIDLMLTKDDRSLNEQNEKKKSSPFGIFSQNALQYFDASLTQVLNRVKLPLSKYSKDNEVKTKFAALTTSERINLITSSYFVLFRNLTELRILNVREVCRGAKNFSPYVGGLQFPASAIKKLTPKNSRFSMTLTGQKRTSIQGSMGLQSSPDVNACWRLLEAIKRCDSCIKDFLIAITSHLECDFSSEDITEAAKLAHSLTDSMSTLAIDDKISKETTEKRLTIRKLLDYKRLFEQIESVFDRIIRATKNKGTAPFTL